MSQSPQNLVNDAYIQEITTHLQGKGNQALEALLENFPRRDNKTKSRVLFEVSVSKNETAFYALNRMINAPGIQSKDSNEVLDVFLEKAVTDARFIVPFIDHAPIPHLKSSIPVLANILLNETDTHILQKTIAAIGKAKDPSCINVVADFIFYDHEELKRAAIDTLARIGGKSVIERLSFASTTSKSDPHLVATLERLTASTSSSTDGSLTTETRQFASQKDRLSDLAEDSDIAQLLLLLASDSPHDRHLAIDGLIEVGPQAIPALCEKIDLSDVDSMINGLDILGNICHETALPFILKILGMHHKDSNVRFAAYEALSRIPKVHSSMSLIDGITDASEQVRLAAATAINNNVTDIIIAGIKSKIETSGRQSKRTLVISAIIDSHSGLLFDRLMDSDAFVFHAMEYLVQSHPSTVSYFIDILTRRGTLSHVKNIRSRIESQGKKPGRSVFCVDDSSICLKYYVRVIHMMGHAPTAFESPEEALDALKSHQPDVIISDLNMLSMNGLQFAEQVRKMPEAASLPIVIITTQKDFVSTFQHAKTGADDPARPVNSAIHKPPSPKDLKRLFESL